MTRLLDCARPKPEKTGRPIGSRLSVCPSTPTFPATGPACRAGQGRDWDPPNRTCRKSISGGGISSFLAGDPLSTLCFSHHQLVDPALHHPIAVASLSVRHGRRPPAAGSCRRGIAKLHHVCAPLDCYHCSHHRQHTPYRILIWYSHDAHDETCSCDVSDALCKLKFRNGGFLLGLTMWSPRRQDGDTKIVGPAYTVQYAPLGDPRPKHPTHYVCSVLSPRGWGHGRAELAQIDRFGPRRRCHLRLMSPQDSQRRVWRSHVHSRQGKQGRRVCHRRPLPGLAGATRLGLSRTFSFLGYLLDI
jgi:hypothetical protein